MSEHPTPIDPTSLRGHYGAFLRPDRVLLTGHSHQAWPDVARDGLLESFADAAAHADDKWSRAGQAADAVRDAVVDQLGGHRDEIALGVNTHELITRFVSALDLRRRPTIVTTDGEFHSMFRQLRRLSEEGVALRAVPSHPVATLAERVAAAVDDQTAGVMVSTVLFETTAVVPHLKAITEAAHRVGAAVLFDQYHAFNALPQKLPELGPDPVFVTGGGYKYAQWGEEYCYLRVPRGTELRPVFTGWFSDFANLGAMRDPSSPIRYGQTPADRFTGSTYDPASHYRARAVIRFFDAQGLGVDRLRATSLRQTRRLIDRLADRFELATPVDDAARGGFVSVRVAEAARVVAAMRERGVFVDARGDLLRLGPAPYTTDDELDRGVDALIALAGSGAR
ncbi:MAG TPA: aminotransferase class V-fold PLP-dependent enzyme [Polyangiaceae bacterium LLY-WYZ-14_1]|nr:aminotransferase class V-fold PLP-dependent enzyme [Polyangiaceae bacterium LLY-WYZ-14_1]